MAGISYRLIKGGVFIVAVIGAFAGAVVAADYWDFAFQRGFLVGLGVVMVLGCFRLPPALYDALLMFAERRGPIGYKNEFDFVLLVTGMALIALALLAGDRVVSFFSS